MFVRGPLHWPRQMTALNITTRIHKQPLASRFSERSSLRQDYPNTCSMVVMGSAMGCVSCSAPLTPSATTFA